jgi:anti-sigma regulatory factor (Ser/Thr protein kinase)
MPAIAEDQQVLLALEPRPESARLVRRALAASGLCDDVAHTAALLATEVVGNAVRHAGLNADARIVFFATVADGRARIQVADSGPGFDPDTVQTEGYGLKLLDSLASRWGVATGDRGCRVWFEVDSGADSRERYAQAA